MKKEREEEKEEARLYLRSKTHRDVSPAEKLTLIRYVGTSRNRQRNQNDEGPTELACLFRSLIKLSPPTASILSTNPFC